jgi:hypothetical protein
MPASSCYPVKRILRAVRRLIAWNSADLRAWGIASEESLRTPTKACLPVDVAGCGWTNCAPIDMRLRYARWMSVDVLGWLPGRIPNRS